MVVPAHVVFRPGVRHVTQFMYMRHTFLLAAMLTRPQCWPHLSLIVTDCISTEGPLWVLTGASIRTHSPDTQHRHPSITLLGCRTAAHLDHTTYYTPRRAQWCSHTPTGGGGVQGVPLGRGDNPPILGIDNARIPLPHIHPLGCTFWVTTPRTLTTAQLTVHSTQHDIPTQQCNHP